MSKTRNGGHATVHLRDASPMARKGHGARLRRTDLHPTIAWRLSYASDDRFVVHDIPIEEVPRTARSVTVMGPNFAVTRHVNDSWTTVIRRTRVSVGCTDVPPGALRRLLDASDRMVRTARDRRRTLSEVTQRSGRSEWDVEADGSVASHSPLSLLCGRVTRDTVLAVKRLLS